MKPPPEDSNERVVEYIARQAARHLGAITPDLPGKVRRNVKRNFGASLSVEDVAFRLSHYKAIYLFAAGLLHNDVAAWEKEMANAGDAAYRQFVQRIAAKFPGEYDPVVNTIARYAIYYEIMR